MKKIIPILFLSIISITNVYSQDITEAFLSMPDDIITGLDAELRDRLVADPEDTIIAKVETPIYDNVKRLAISDNFISVRTSNIGNTQIKILPLINNSKIICVIKTVCDDICDSDVSFYTTDWEPISKSKLIPSKEVLINRFLKENSETNTIEYKNAIASIDMLPIKFSLSAEEPNITASFDMKSYLSKDDYKLLQPYLKEEPIILIWDKASFK